MAGKMTRSIIGLFRPEWERFATKTGLHCSTVFVTHRLSSVKMAQNILVLKDGELIEQGSRAGLVALGGEYAKMFKLQAERYL